MKTLCPSTPSRRTALLAAFALILTTACALTPRASAQEATKSETGNGLVPATVTPYAEFQNATLTGTTNTINVTNLPVVTSTGSIIYDNVTVAFNVAADGTLTVASTTVVAAPEPVIDGFVAANYGAGDAYLITVSGPGVGPGGTTQWMLTGSQGANIYTTPNNANWYVGPMNKNNPMYTRLQKAGILSTPYATNYYFGVGSAYSGSFWENNSLLGFAQTNNGLIIASFSNGGVDYNAPQTTIEYELLQP